MESDREHDSCLGKESMTTLEERLETWIYNSCKQNVPQPRLFSELNCMFRDIYHNPRFCRYRDERNPNDYEDALCLVYEYFRRNLCKASKASKSGLSFMETRMYAVPRLIKSLRGNLKNIRQERYEEEAIQAQPHMGDDGGFGDILEEWIEPEPDPEPEYDPVEVWRVFLELLEEDPEGELNASTNTLKGITKTTEQPYVLSAQTYLLMKHRDKMTIHQIADTLDIRHGSVLGGVKPKKWRDLAHKYAQMAKDLVLERGGDL